MRIIREIDKGGFGRVEEIELADGTRLARKVFDPSADVLSATSDDKLRHRFRREVSSQINLSNEHVIPIIQHDLTSDEMWYTMPLCDRNFQHQIQIEKAAGTIPKEALLQIADALEEIHSLYLKHRDLTPRNILFHEGRWKLADFGLVSPLPNSESDVSSSLAAWGTFGYMAPEPSLDFKSVDHTVDIYAFGCILHDIFTDGQRVAFSKQTCDGSIGMIIERCTENEPRHRFQDIATLRAALITALAEPHDFQPSAESTEWADFLSSDTGWDKERLRAFSRYVASLSQADDKFNIFRSLDEVRIERFLSIDVSYAESILDDYCEWVIDNGFDFDFCDVLAQRLKTIFLCAQNDMKAKAILALANLGKTHHRFYVMRLLSRLAGAEMLRRMKSYALNCWRCGSGIRRRGRLVIRERRMSGCHVMRGLQSGWTSLIPFG